MLSNNDSNGPPTTSTLCKKCHPSHNKLAKHKGPHRTKLKTTTPPTASSGNGKRGRPKKNESHLVPPAKARRQSSRTAIVKVVATHQVAECDPDHIGRWKGLWNACVIVEERAKDKVDIRILSDNSICKNVPTRFVRKIDSGATSRDQSTRYGQMGRGSEKRKGSKKPAKNKPKKRILPGKNPNVSKHNAQIIRSAVARMPATSTGSLKRDVTKCTKEIANVVQNYPCAVAAASVDATLTNQEIAEQSQIARQRDSRRRSSRGSKKRKTVWQKEQNDRIRAHGKEHGFRTCFCDHKQSVARASKSRLRDGYETWHEAKQRSIQQLKSAKANDGVRGKWLYQNEYKGQLLGVTKRIEINLKRKLGSLWHTQFESHTDLRTHLSSLGKNNQNTKDLIFDPLRKINSTSKKSEKWLPNKSWRGTMIKQILKFSGRVFCDGFWDDDVHVRRKRNGKINLQTPGTSKYEDAKKTWDGLENHPSAVLLNYQDHLFKIDKPPFTETNPSPKFEGDLMHIQDTISKIHIFYELKHQEGLTNFKKRSEIVELAREQKIILLREAGYPIDALNAIKHGGVVVPTLSQPLIDRLKLPDDDDELTELVLKYYNTIGLGLWTDNGVLIGADSLNCVVVRPIFRRWQFKADISSERLEQLRLEFLKPHVSSLGKCTSKQLDLNKMIAATAARSVVAADTPYQLGQTIRTITPQEAYKFAETGIDVGENETNVFNGGGDGGSGIYIKMRYQLLLGDGEALQAISGVMQSGRGSFKDPASFITIKERTLNLTNTLLALVRSVQEDTKTFGTGPGDDRTRAYASGGKGNGGLSNDEWRREYEKRTPPGTVIPGDAGSCKDHIRFKVLMGVTARCGLYDGLEYDDERLSGLQVMFDKMHAIGKHLSLAVNKIVEFYNKRHPGNTAAKDTMQQVLRDGGKRPADGMSLAEWAKVAMYLYQESGTGGSVILTKEERNHLYVCIHLRRLLYTHLHKSRNSGIILSLMCVTVKFVLSHEKLFLDPLIKWNKNKTRNQLHGLYQSSLIFLGLNTARLDAVETGCCETLEAALKPQKHIMQNRSNMKVNECFVSGLLRRCTAADEIEKAINVSEKKKRRKVESAISKMYRQTPELRMPNANLTLDDDAR